MPAEPGGENWRCRLGLSAHRIHQRADAVDGDCHNIAGLQCEFIARDDACAGHEQRSRRESVVTIKKSSQFRRRAFELGNRSLPGENRLTSAADGDVDLCFRGKQVAGDVQAGANGGAELKAFGLREVERILALNIAAGKIIADGITDNLATRVDDESQFRFRHHPLRITAQMHGLARISHALRCGFEKNLRTLCGIDAIVKTAASAIFTFLHPRCATAIVGDPSSPYLLRANGRDDRLRRRSGNRRTGASQTGEIAVQIFMSDQTVPILIGKTVPMIGMQIDALKGTKEMHENREISGARRSVKPAACLLDHSKSPTNAEVMKLSKKAEYALRALLAMARAPETTTFAIQDIATSEHIPLKFLEQILLILKNGGLLRSKRGVGGGYQFQKVPSRITLGEVITLIDGAFMPIPCAAGDASTCECGTAGGCGLGQTLGMLRDQVNAWLNTTTLAHVLEREKRDSVTFEI